MRIAFIKLNDRQHVELFNEPPRVAHNMLSHLCFSVDDIEQMSGICGRRVLRCRRRR